MTLLTGTAAADDPFDISEGDILIKKGDSLNFLNVIVGSNAPASVPIGGTINIIGTSMTNTVVVDGTDLDEFDTDLVTIEINNLEITSTTRSAFSLQNGANVKLILSGENILTGGTAANYAGQAGLEVQEDCSLEIAGDGKLTATGGNGINGDSVVGGGGGGGGSGIGSGGGRANGGIGGSVGSIVISEAVIITANGGSSSAGGGGSGIGIGGGGFYSKDIDGAGGSVDIIEISAAATITANGGSSSAGGGGSGIGSGGGGLNYESIGGSGGSVGIIEISAAATITANGGNGEVSGSDNAGGGGGSGIGTGGGGRNDEKDGGVGGSVNTIDISAASTITANGGVGGGSGIGSGGGGGSAGGGGGGGGGSVDFIIVGEAVIITANGGVGGGSGIGGGGGSGNTNRGGDGGSVGIIKIGAATAIAAKGGVGGVDGVVVGGGGSGIGSGGGGGSKADKGGIGGIGGSVETIEINDVATITVNGGIGGESDLIDDVGGDGSGIGSGGGGNSADDVNGGDGGSVGSVKISGEKTDIIVVSGGIGRGAPGKDDINTGDANILIDGGNILILNQPETANAVFKNNGGDLIYPVSFKVMENEKNQKQLGNVGISVENSLYQAITRENANDRLTALSASLSPEETAFCEEGTVTLWLPSDGETETTLFLTHEEIACTTKQVVNIVENIYENPTGGELIPIYLETSASGSKGGSTTGGAKVVETVKGDEVGSGNSGNSEKQGTDSSQVSNNDGDKKPEAGDTNNDAKKGLSRTGWILIGIVFMIAAAGIGVYLYRKNK
ncbi:hypothetical protein [Methanimicrococcus hacksteinii]|uniref:hypothetical protein n=1 Tax=Methanimicrococcus hacksteinii TaxID=3028293 RepID=UPI00298EFCCE|nr:hypothetical protein [Methanimicrococcus sp. At1]